VHDWSTVALLPQRLGLTPHLTVAENALLPCWVRGIDPPADLLDLLGLGALAARPAGRTSLGEQQRTGVARALAARPRVAVLDEPTGHQDDDNTARVRAALHDAARGGCAVLVATHDPALVEAATRVVRLHRGRVVG
jgi:ABC-type lipoprotein export system ATPase subunit